MDGEEKPAWRQFDGTELGSLLSKLYGNNHKNCVKYPKLSTGSKWEASSHTFRPVNNRATCTDPTKRLTKDCTIAYPTYKKNVNENVAPIDLIVKRKTGKVIEKELDDIRYKNEHYRPSNTKCISESEKERLTQVFTYKGGKALPEELTNPVSLAPYEIRAQQKERNRINEVKSKRGILKETASAAPLSVHEQLKQQIQEEIDERYAYINDMKSLKQLKKHEERRLLDEINGRFSELEKL